MSFDYWTEAVSEAMDDAGVSVSPGQLNQIADAMRNAHEMEWEATGQEHIPNPLKVEVERAKAEGKRKAAELEASMEQWRQAWGRAAGRDPSDCFMGQDGYVQVNR